jgi:hypothetical protein
VQITVSHIRLAAVALGCTVLCVSFFDWTQNLKAAEDGYVWVNAESSGTPAVETSEIWESAASCARPYFIKAALRSKATLKAHYDNAPEQVRAWQSRAAPPHDDSQPSPRLVSTRDKRSVAEMERDASLHAQYAEWYATVFKLTTDDSRWERRLGNVADQRVVLADATRSNFQGYSSPDGKGDFEHYVFGLLGLGGFPADLEYGLGTNCVRITHIKKIHVDANYFREIWRWPIDHIGEFSIGLELILIGAIFGPLALWIVTGNLQTVRLYIRGEARRLDRKFRELYRRCLYALSLIFRVIRIQTRAVFRAIDIRAGAVLKALMTSGLSHSNFDWPLPMSQSPINETMAARSRQRPSAGFAVE